MQKLFYLLFDSPEADGAALRDRLIEEAAPRLREAGAQEITVFASDEAVAAGRPVRQSDPPIRAIVSFWLEDAADRSPCEVALAAQVREIAGYLVVESRPVVHERPVGTRTEGMKQITCITKRADLDSADFVRIWHEDHRDVAIETQSTFGYVRNEIFRTLTADAPTRWDAFVEESFPIEALTDPQVFFDAADAEALARNAKRMTDSCARFLDLTSIEVTFVSEYYLG